MNWWIDKWELAWDDFREEGFADVQTALEWCQERASSHFESQEQAKKRGDLDTAEKYGKKAEALERRAEGLKMLLEHMAALYGPNAPRWRQVAHRRRPELGGSDAPRYATILVEVYNDNRNEIDKMNELDEFASDRLGGNWKNRRSNIRDRLNQQGLFWQKRDVESFIQTLARFEDVDADFGDSEESENSPE